MTKRLGQTAFVELLAGSIAGDATMQNVAAALDQVLTPSVRGIPALLLLSRPPLADASAILPPLARLAEQMGGLVPLPEDILDSLAWQLHVDGYEAAVTYEDKRRMVDRSLLLHRRKGTPWAVAEALRALGYADARIIEGFGAVLYDGEIAHDGLENYAIGNRWALFDVEIDLGDDMGISAASIARLRVAIEAWKNVRSWLRAFSWRTSMADDFPIADLDNSQEPWTVIPGYADTRPWGHPLYNGEIYYNNAIVRRYDGARLHDGTWPYSPLQASGYTHNAQLDHMELGLRAALQDAVHFQPLHNGDLAYNAQALYGPMDSPAIDALQTSLRADLQESVRVTESVSVALQVSAKDQVGRYYDGAITHGQRYISLHNGEIFYDASRQHQEYGGKPDFHAIRFDGRILHNNAADHAPWAWHAGASGAPVFTYATLSDSAQAELRLTGFADALDLADAADVHVYQYTLNNNQAIFDGSIVYDAREVQ